MSEYNVLKEVHDTINAIIFQLHSIAVQVILFIGILMQFFIDVHHTNVTTINFKYILDFPETQEVEETHNLHNYPFNNVISSII